MESHLTHKPNLAKGALFCLLGYFCISLMGAAAKGIPANIPATTIVFFQNLVCLILTSIGLTRKGFGHLKTQRPWLHLVRDVAGLLSFFALFTAIQSIPFVDAMLLQNAAPLWIPFVVMIWLRQKVPSHTWIGVIVGFIGVLLILKPGAGMFQPSMMMGLASGIFLAIALVTIRRLSLTEPTARILFYYFLVGTLATIPFVWLHWIPLSRATVLLLIAVGIFMYLAQVFITYAFTHAKASTLSPISYTTILFSGILGWLFFKHVPDWLAILGMVLVIVGGITTLVLEGRKKAS